MTHLQHFSEVSTSLPPDKRRFAETKKDGRPFYVAVKRRRQRLWVPQTAIPKSHKGSASKKFNASWGSRKMAFFFCCWWPGLPFLRGNLILGKGKHLQAISMLLVGSEGEFFHQLVVYHVKLHGWRKNLRIKGYFCLGSPIIRCFYINSFGINQRPGKASPWEKNDLDHTWNHAWYTYQLVNHNQHSFFVGSAKDPHLFFSFDFDSKEYSWNTSENTTSSDDSSYF